MRIILCIFVAVLSIFSLSLAASQADGKTLIFAVTDERMVISQDIDEKLLLRIRKDTSGLGWEVEVVRKPCTMSSLNLLYHSRDWHGPYPSQIYAWHIARNYFSNKRDLETHGYPYNLTIELINLVIEETGTNVRFVSGMVKVAWKRKR